MLAEFERYPLAFGPTPIEHLPRLTAHLGGAVDIFAKRQDCNPQRMNAGHGGGRAGVRRAILQKQPETRSYPIRQGNAGSWASASW